MANDDLQQVETFYQENDVKGMFSEKVVEWGLGEYLHNFGSFINFDFNIFDSQIPSDE